MSVDTTIILGFLAVLTAIFIYLFNKLDKKIDRLENKIGSIKTELNSKIEQVRTELNAKIEKVEAKIEQVRTELSTKIEGVTNTIHYRIDNLYHLIYPAKNGDKIKPPNKEKTHFNK